jgi:hypothetical protein
MGTNSDIYGIERKLERTLQKLENSTEISAENKHFICSEESEANCERQEIEGKLRRSIVCCRATSWRTKATESFLRICGRLRNNVQEMLQKILRHRRVDKYEKYVKVLDLYVC